MTQEGYCPKWHSQLPKELLPEVSEETTGKILEKIVKRIDFDEVSSPVERPNVISDGFYQHKVITAMETIPGFSEQLGNQSFSETVSDNVSQESPISTCHKNNFKGFSQEVSGSIGSESYENFTCAKSFFNQGTCYRVTSNNHSVSDTPKKLNESTRRLSITKPLNNYIAYSSDEELEDWWDQPKTDYTYSASLTYRDSVTPERRIGSPNMSRRGLKGGGSGYLTSPAFSHASVHTSASDSLALRSREIPRRDAGGVFSDESDTEESHVGVESRGNAIKHEKYISSHRSSVKGSRSVHTSRTSSTVVKCGLDVDSDADSESPPHFARPIVRKGFNSFIKSFDSLGPASDTNSYIKSSSTNFSNGKSNIRMGNRLVSTSAESSVTTLSSRFWEKLNGRREHSRSQEWKGKLSEWRHHSWAKVKSTFVTIYTSVLLWLTYISETVRSLIFHRKQKSNNLRVGKTNSLKTSLNLTTTTVMSTRQTIVTYFEKVFTRYKNSQKRHPTTWLWLPLLLLLLTSLIILYLFRNSSNTSGESSLLPVWMSQYFEKFLNLIYDAYSFILVIFFSLVKGAIQIFDFVVFALFYLTELLKNFIYTSFGTLYSISTGILNYIYSFILYAMPSSSSTPEQQEITQNSDSYKTSFYSDMTMFWSNAKQTLKYASYSSWIYLVDGCTYLVGSSWDGIVWLAISFCHMITNLLSYLWLLLSFCFDAIFSAITGIALLPRKLFKEISPSTSQQSYVTLTTSSQPSSEELVEQVLKSPRLLAIIVGALQENLDKRAIPDETLATLRMNIESEVNKLRSEIIQHDHDSLNRFSASKEEIDSLRTQQEVMINELRDIDSRLRGVLTWQETDRETEWKEYLDETLSSVTATLDKLSKSVVILQEDHVDLAGKVRSCCNNASLTMEEVEKYVALLLSDLIGFNSDNKAEEFSSSRFGSWLSNYYATKEELKAELSELWLKAQSHIKKSQSDNDALRSDDVNHTAELVMAVVLEQMKEQIKVQLKPLQDQIKEQLRLELQTLLESRVDDAMNSKEEDRLNVLVEQTIPAIIEQNLNVRLSALNVETEGEAKSWSKLALNATVEQIVKEALLKYDADKTGMVDHALESGGGSIVSTRCTEGYQGHQAELTLFGYSFYRYTTNTPRAIIQPDRNPGQCYAFKGSQGYIVIQFAGHVRMTGFTMEHIPKVLTPSGSIDSAPRDFSVYGLHTLQMVEEEAFHFGDFIYSEEGEPLQYFSAQKLSEEYFPYMELRIKSNHGNMKYTCLYRFRVHGVRKPEE